MLVHDSGVWQGLQHCGLVCGGRALHSFNLPVFALWFTHS